MRRKQTPSNINLEELKTAETGKEREIATRLVLPESLHSRLKYYCDNNGGRSNSMTKFINAAIEERLDRLEEAS